MTPNGNQSTTKPNDPETTKSERRIQMKISPLPIHAIQKQLKKTKTNSNYNPLTNPHDSETTKYEYEFKLQPTTKANDPETTKQRIRIQTGIHNRNPHNDSETSKND